MVGKTGTFDTLGVVCSRLPGTGQNLLLVGTNTGLVRRLLIPLAKNEDLTLKRIHPQLHQAFQLVVRELRAPTEGVVRLWRLGEMSVLPDICHLSGSNHFRGGNCH